eukprot:1133221-Pelagomonas_calceolata.AAC.5
MPRVKEACIHFMKRIEKRKDQGGSGPITFRRSCLAGCQHSASVREKYVGGAVPCRPFLRARLNPG